MSLHFTKMHGLGNDFMIIDATQQPVALTPEKIRAWADRHRGVGFDQCLVLSPATNPEADFYYQIFNADGSEVAQCGNGARCMAWFIHANGLSEKNPLRLQTKLQILELTQRTAFEVEVNLGPPLIPVAPVTLRVDSDDLLLHTVNVGNPHAVLQVPDAAMAAVERIGSQLVTHAYFPEGANIGFMQIDSPHDIHLRVYERGAGETEACGSGACAAAVIGIQLGKLQSPVQVQLPGGTLVIEWEGGVSPIRMRGPVTPVFEGVL